MKKILVIVIVSTSTVTAVTFAAPVPKPIQKRDIQKLPLAAMFYQDLERKALVTRATLVNIFQEIKADIPSVEIKLPPLKSFERTKEKVDAEYGGNWQKVTDIVRGSLSFQTIEDLKKGLDLFSKKFPLLYIKNRFDQPTIEGYQDILVLFRDPENDIIGEVQFHICHMLKAKKTGHVLYELRQKIARNAQVLHRSLTKEEQQLIENNIQQARMIYQRALQRMQDGEACS